MRALYDVLAQRPWQRKVLVGRSFTEGHLLIERMAKAYGPVANVEVKTLEAMALDLASLPLEKRGLQRISDEALTWVIHRLLTTLADVFPTVLDAQALTPGTVNVFQRSVLELRRNGVRSSDLDPSQFVNADKGRLLQRLLAGVEAYLAAHQQADVADAIQGATERLGHTRLPYELVILSESLRVDGRMRTFLEKMQTVVECVRVTDVPPSPSQLTFNGDVQLFAAAGSISEVREVLRRVLGAGVALDEIEIATSGTDDEVLAIHGQATRFGLPVTFSQGLPGYFTRNGQLASAYLAWIDSNYDVSYLLGALRQGILRVPDLDATTIELIRCLEEANIGWGRARYVPLLKKLADSAEETAPLYEALTGVAEDLFKHLPTADAGDWSVQALLVSIQQLIETYGAAKGEAETSVLMQIRDLNRAIATVGTPPMSLNMAVEYTRDLLSRMRVHVATRPEPGALHVSNWSNGGLSGRKWTFITGLSESNWGVSVTQDPILLDVEKSAIGHGLILSDELTKRNVEDKLRLFHMVAGDVVLSYSAYDMVENKPEAPASILLQVYRASHGQPEADYTDMQRAIGQPIGYAVSPQADRPTAVLDATDLWMTQMVDATGRMKDATRAMLDAYPGIRSGQQAEDARESDDLTEFDGMVGASDSAVVAVAADAGEPQRPTYISTSALETLAKCPRKYFYQYALKLRPEETTEFDRAQWLNPLDKGSLYHEVFQTYMAHVTGDGVHPVYHDEAVLLQICDEVIAAYREEIPAPSMHIVDLESQQIRASMRKFLSMEQGRDGIPRYFELAIGSRDAPFMVDLGDGVQLPLSAVIDRVDQLAPDTYRIIDYKTGRSSRYRESEPFKGGQQLQHAIYALAVEQWLAAEHINPSARVADSAYVFPTLRAKDMEVSYTQDAAKRRDLRDLVSRMLSVIDKGVFPASADYNKTCRWCDYEAICTRRDSERSKEKRENPANRDVLAQLLEVEDYA